mmetsp:Transcript_1154/g.2850  ORF Transcript_1154/g.2850 Transcript_1154/m.2850 type:complete len:579 (-) Transcript_1154:67-1803(-)
MMQQLMTMDTGARRVNVVALPQTMPSPAHALSSLGSASFREPLDRMPADQQERSDKREDRHGRGYVPFEHEPVVPDMGGLGWRTKTGHMIKNQAFYEMKPINKWDSPTHAGVNTWKEWHGPRMRTDADTMERLDRFEQEQEHLAAKRTFVNTRRVQTLDRFYNRKVNRTQLEAASSWAPHLHARREVHDKHNTFDGTLDEKPAKQLKKVFTEEVLKRDRQAIRAITQRIQNEETWKLAFKQMEAERRADIRADFQQRQAHTDRLMMMSGQPVRIGLHDRQLPNNCSQRSEEMALPRQHSQCKDVTTNIDFRGLIHADNEHALEALFPGAGHELSVEFRARATESTAPGWPPPPPAETPRMRDTKKNREAEMQQSVSMSKASIPASTQRLAGIGVRSNEDLHQQHAKAQFLPTRAPPPPNQKESLLEEDWSPAATLHDKGRVTGDFSRTEHSFMSHGKRSMEKLPPPRRQMVYHVVVPASPKAADPSPSNKPDGLSLSMMSLSRNESAPAILGGAAASRGPKRGRLGAAEAPVSAVCRELDSFEASYDPVPRIRNFFHTPRAHGQRSASRPTEPEGAAT